jgi:hypothetical protein
MLRGKELIMTWKKNLDGSLVANWHEYRRHSRTSGRRQLQPRSDRAASRKPSVAFPGLAQAASLNSRVRRTTGENVKGIFVLLLLSLSLFIPTFGAEDLIVPMTKVAAQQSYQAAKDVGYSGVVAVQSHLLKDGRKKMFSWQEAVTSAHKVPENR